MFQPLISLGFLLMHLGCFSGYSSLIVLRLNLKPFFLLCQKLKWQNPFASQKSLPFTFEGENSIETNLQTCNLWTSQSRLQSPCYNYNVGQATTCVKCRKPSQVFIHLQGFGSSLLADNLIKRLTRTCAMSNVCKTVSMEFAPGKKNPIYKWISFAISTFSVIKEMASESEWQSLKRIAADQSLLELL